MRPRTFSVLIAIALLSMACQSDSDRAANSTPTSPESVPISQTYQLPSNISFEAVAERGPEGQIFITGSTNLPDGLKFGVEIPGNKWKETITTHQGRKRAVTKWAQQVDLVIHNGHFRSDGFMLNRNLYPAGQYEVQFYAYFNGGSQSKEILSIVDYGGKNLRGKIFKKEDPDVIDSDLVLDYTVRLVFPPPSQERSELAKKAREAEAIDLAPKSRESAAIDLVNKSTLTVQGSGRSYATIQETVDYYMGVPGM